MEVNDGYSIRTNQLSAPIGVILVVLGGALVLAALARQRGAERDIAVGAYRPQGFLTTALALGVTLAAALLAVYLVISS